MRQLECHAADLRGTEFIKQRIRRSAFVYRTAAHQKTAFFSDMHEKIVGIKLGNFFRVKLIARAELARVKSKELGTQKHRKLFELQNIVLDGTGKRQVLGNTLVFKFGPKHTGHMFYLYGADTVKAACKDVFCATMSSTAGYATAKEAGEALLANRSKYYGILDGINMYAMGDSYFGGSAVRKGITWVNQMGNKYGMDYINYGIGGSTMSAYVTNKDPMCIRYKTMEKGPCDLILLEGGRNDRSQLVPIGTNDTRDIKTFKGAVNTMIDGMLKTYPDALIVLVTAWYNTAKTSAGKSNVDFANALRELAEYRNDPRVICLYAADKNATGVDMDSAAFRAKYCCTSSDVSHLNGAGMEMIQPYMEKFLAEALAEYKGLTVDGEPIPAEPEVTTPAETDPVTVPEDTTPSPETTPVETTPAPVEKTGCGGVIGGAVALVALISVAGCAVLKKNKE